jgi:hypothetical protein
MKGEIGSVLLLFLQFLAAAADGLANGNSRLVCLEDEVDDPPDELGDPLFSSNFELIKFPPILPPPPPA